MSGLRFDREAALVLEVARGAGAGDAEAYFHLGVELTVRANAGEVVELTSAEARGVGVRVFGDSRMGFSHTSDLSDDGLRSAVESAVEACRHNGPDEAVGLPDEMPGGDLAGLVAPDFDGRPVGDRVEMALELERLTTAHRAEVRRCDRAVYGDERSWVELHSTRGVAAGYASTIAYCYADAIAERGDEMQSGWSLALGRSASALDLAACAAEAADRAAALLGAERLASRTTAVVIEPWAAASLLGTLASSISAEAVQKGRSLLAGRIGDRVASPAVTLIDDGRLAAGLASRPWDGEGVPTRRTSVIEAGILSGFLHSAHTARRDPSAHPTGNAARASYRSTPELAPTNLVLMPGTRGRDALLETMGDGLLVTDLHGLHTVNPVTGEFSLGISGHVVEGGHVGAAVREMTVAGDLLGLLAGVVEVGSDLRFTIGAGFLGAPSLLVDALAVSGG